MEKYEFSHEDYLMYQFHFVNEKEREIIGSVSKVKTQKHDKTFKEVLKDKKEMSEFLKHFIEMEVEESKLQIYNSEFINNKYEKRISDIIYKEKEKEVYYLIEHQSKVDVNIPNRILEYCMELMKEVKKNQNLNNATNPLIVPIVLYTGTKKWNVSENFSDTEKVEEKYKKYAIDLKYKLVDINKYSKEELTNKNTKMTSMMLIEKCKNDEETRDVIMKLWKKANSERKEWLKNLLRYAYSQLLKDDKILKLLDEKERSSMDDWIERMKANRRREDRELKKEAKKEGIKETIKSVIRNMLKANQDEEFIMQITNVKRNEIDKIRRELEASY